MVTSVYRNCGGLRPRDEIRRNTGSGVRVHKNRHEMARSFYGGRPIAGDDTTSRFRNRRRVAVMPQVYREVHVRRG